MNIVSVPSLGLKCYVDASGESLGTRCSHVGAKNKYDSYG